MNKDILRALMSEADGKLQDSLEPFPALQAEGHAEQLMALAEKWVNKPTFQVFDVVVVDEDFRLVKIPRPGQPAVVLETLKHPIVRTDSDSAGTPYHGMKYDTRILLYDRDGDCTQYLFPHEMLKPFKVKH